MREPARLQHPRLRFWGNLAGYQLVWFAAVIGAGRGVAWPAVVASVLFIAWQLALSLRRGRELRLLALALGLGLLIDGGLSLSGLARYATPAPAWPTGTAPLWILCVWMSFAMTVPQSLAFLQPRPWLAAIFGAVGGPLAYLGAARGWGAVAFVAPAAFGLSVLALAWAVAMPLLSTLSARWSRPHAGAPHHASGRTA
ncbi:MAG: DUF2878 domain-containing protein [Luteimonas sp.]|nr:DUF2878 domain-containing protein [Luteimonas sp.]